MTSSKRFRNPKRKRAALTLVLGLYGVAFAIMTGCRPDNDTSGIPRSSSKLLADETSCAGCHPKQSEAHRHSAHALTSSLPVQGNLKGDFRRGTNLLETSNPNLSFRMEERDGAYFQTARFITPTRTFERTERIALAVGSGRKGQTYLYWDHDQLYELPVSWWVATSEWMNSPGYPEGTANFDRGVSRRCLECHATSFTGKGEAPHEFVPSSIVPGISCQKCHGPAASHVAWEHDKKGPPPAGFGIVNPAKLPRARQMDLCSLCHAGVGKALQPPLSYQAGDDLSRFLTLKPPVAGTHTDPHGSQFQTLGASRCFQESGTLTCLTCHDVHETQRSLKEFSQQCLTCHQVSSCGGYKTKGERLRANCIDCHMPLETTAKIIMRLNGERHQPLVRSHRIGIYPGTMKAKSQPSP